MAIRLRDIAEQAGVSVTTVSHVLNGYTKSGIKQETWERVKQIAQELGYRPNAIARSLKNQRTHAVGFYTGYGFRDARDPFMGEIYTGIQHACDELDLDFLIHGSVTGKDGNEIKMKLADGRVDGLIVHAPASDPVVACLTDANLPAVAIADKLPNTPSVVADDRCGMQLLIDYLWERGHRRIAYLTSHVELTSIQARSETFLRVMAERGGEASVTTFPWGRAKEFLEEWRQSPDAPTAMCCWNDNSAYHLIKTCLDIGIRIPEELAIVGFDGLLVTRLPARNLVTIHVPWDRIANEAVKMVLKQTHGESVPELTVFPVSLLAGDTA